jgi:hypothetical protein
MPISIPEVFGTASAGDVIMFALLTLAWVIRALIRYDSPITRAMARRIDASKRIR